MYNATFRERPLRTNAPTQPTKGEMKMKVYVLTADTYNGPWGSEIEFFGVFSTKEKAQKRASEMKLDCPDISVVNVDENDVQGYLGGYYE
ncbi:hypothetical protein AM4_043 [Lactococcus phage AM4]|uniref:DUF7336 domain-containing protein n=2 Tax=Audreyjarvisvirus AM4 TaxID=2845189 RepID=A0A1W6JKE9_9CAUD|nr:hypothetical protein H1Z35_gp043 [Lactococcus phage AM4]ARM66702.1 hypothetical protein AM4_043 [Lactococcus phage AM4]ARM66935.1 hypothetical protein AM5_082 [Lactococcus phage AM5]